MRFEQIPLNLELDVGPCSGVEQAGEVDTFPLVDGTFHCHVVTLLAR